MVSSNDDKSPVIAFAERFRSFGPGVATKVALAVFDQLSVVEQAAIAADWSFWARPKQLAPTGSWRTWGFLTGRRFGKTIAVSKWINEQVENGTARLLGCCAQDEQSAVDIQIVGPSGLIATAMPWSRPKWEGSAMRLTWPNGATLVVRTPEVPGKIRGIDYDLYWASELQSWPVTHRDEAWANINLSTSVGIARIVWDATPKRRHPLLRERLADAEASPIRHRIVRGSTHENSANLADDYVAELERKYGGTQRGREELLGEMLSDAEGALVKQVWIEESRRHMPSRLVRRVIGVDPAITASAGSDTTGIVEAGVGEDGQGYVLANLSGKYEPSYWGKIVLDRYVKSSCDLILAETNKGGSMVVEILRALARERGLEVITVGKEERPQKVAGKVFLREVHARGSKAARAEPVATLYERRKISHIFEADLLSLEDTLTEWEPPTEGTSAARKDSPGDLDALVHAMTDLLDLASYVPDARQDFKGINEVVQKVITPQSSALLSSFMSHSFSGSRERGL